MIKEDLVRKKLNRCLKMQSNLQNKIKFKKKK